MAARVSDLANLPDWPRLLSADQAAAYLGMSAEHMARHCAVSPRRIGGRVLYDRVALDRWVDGGAQLEAADGDWTAAY